MKIPLRLASVWRWSSACVAGSILAHAASAQDPDLTRLPAGGLLAASGVLMFCFIMAVAGYVYMAFALKTIADKTGTENAWFAWIPILNVVLMINIARKPLWWLLLLLVPLVNIVVGVIIWMGVAEARRKPNWWGILVIVPVIGVIVPGYLAWSD
jgi:hypothetical protein